MILAIMVIGMLSPLAEAQPEQTETRSDPVFVEVYTFPRYPIGATWDNSTPGDVITLYVNVTNNYLADGVWVQLGFCNRGGCFDSPLSLMEHVSGTLYKFVLPGDYSPTHLWPYYEASSDPASDIYFWLYADSADLSGYAFYPGPDDTVDAHIYPAWPPSQINASATLSKTTMWTNENFWVNGTSNYWNSTSYPKDFSKLLPADECPVSVKVGPNTFPGKTNIWGNYSVLVSAPAVAGQHTVNVTVSNSTANRNVPCKAVNQTITVNAHWMNVSLELNTTTTLPEQQLWANGTVYLDGSTVPAGYDVNVSVEGGEYWNVDALAGGTYAALITSPNATGSFTVNVTVENTTYSVEAWNSTGITVVAAPVPDLVISAADIKVKGTLVEINDLLLNATVSNGGNAAATNFTVNITLDEVLLNSTTRSLNASANTTISILWVAAPGTHYLNVTLDPMNTTEESSEANNFAGITFAVQPDNDLDGMGDATDTDDDNDGYSDTVDAFPFDDDEWLDTDSDGTGNNADTDDDGDGTGDTLDDMPLDPSESKDTDGDGTGNNVDTDDDDDTVLDTDDLFPLDSTESADYDGDGIGDNADTDDDNDGIPDNADLYPLDTDNDGLANTMDSDDDGDGIPDATDTMPMDTDNDAKANDVDSDDDGDGSPDTADVFPLDSTEAIDTDGDGTGNNADTDDDDDGVLDDDDSAPLDSSIGAIDDDENETADSDSNMVIYAVVAIVVVVVVVALVMVMKGKAGKPGAKDGAPEEYTEK